MWEDWPTLYLRRFPKIRGTLLGVTLVGEKRFWETTILGYKPTNADEALANKPGILAKGSRVLDKALPKPQNFAMHVPRPFTYDGHMGGCQHYGPVLVPYFHTAPNFKDTKKT